MVKYPTIYSSLQPCNLYPTNSQELYKLGGAGRGRVDVNGLGGYGDDYDDLGDPASRQDSGSGDLSD
jgi:hypothetical protein